MRHCAICAGETNSPGIIPRTLDTLFGLIIGRNYPRNDLKSLRFNEIFRMGDAEAQKELDFKNLILNTSPEGSLSETCAVSHLHITRMQGCALV